MKDIIRTGGSGTRLHPMTLATSKQLMPVHDKPMVHYPLSTLFLAGISCILIITTPKDMPNFQVLLGDGSKWGISLFYGEQLSPDGLAQAYIIDADFVRGNPSCLVLGDNVFYGHWASELFKIDNDRKVLTIEEQPLQSNWALTGPHFHDDDVVDVAATLQPSVRGELEITDVNRIYLERGKLSVQELGHGYA